MALPLMAAAFAGMSLVGSAMQFQATRRHAAAQKENYEFNAKVMENDAAQVELQTQANIKDLGLQVRRMLGEQRAGAAAGGVTTSGSVLQTMAETVDLATIDVNRLAQEGLYKSRGLRQHAVHTRKVGGQVKREGDIQAALGLLSGVGNLGLSAYLGGGRYPTPYSSGGR